MENLNEKIILAKSGGQYSNNGYPLIFELYYYSDNNDDLLYLDIYPDETQQDFFSELYEETLQDCLKYNTHQTTSCDYSTINQTVKNFTNDYDACFEYDDETGEFFGNCY